MKLSVVMAIYNGAAQAAATIESILAQTIGDFELLVIDDGSTDETPAILAAIRDPRLQVIRQENAGLTRALIRGCAEARADVIARHDCGDRSHPERFARELALLEQGHALAACWTKFVDADGDLLYVARAEGAEVRDSLLHDDAQHIHALPHHGSAMFRRDAYLAAGGYRPQFRFAQDLDLWIRMVSRGASVGIVDEVLYEALFDARSISGGNRDAQVRLTEIAVALRDGGAEIPLLEEAARVGPSPSTPRHEAAALYFIGKCLLAQRNPKGRRYLRQTLQRNPMHWRAWASFFLGR